MKGAQDSFIGAFQKDKYAKQDNYFAYF